MIPTRRHGRLFTASCYRAPSVLLCVAVAVAGCRTGGTRDRGIRAVRLTDVGGYVEFVARSRDIEQQFKTGAGQKGYKETILEQNVRVDLEGFVYHPNLLEFTLGGLFGLLQLENTEIINERKRAQSDAGEIYEFDLSGQFFKKKDFPGQVFARRRRAVEPRRFRSSLETTTTTYGVNWQYVHPKMPTSFQFNHTSVDLNPYDPEEDDGQQRNTTLRFETGYHFTEHNSLSFYYDRRSIEQQPFELIFDTDELTFSHLWDFGLDYRHRLDSEVNIFDQRGTYDIQRMRWRETLRLQHTETLQSWYVTEAITRVQGSLAGVQPIDETSYAFSGTVEHQLYDSLTTQALGFYRTQNFETGPRIDRVGGQLSFDYRKKNRWGAVRAAYRIRAQTEQRSGGEQDVEFIDEQRTFRDPEPITLTAVNINVSSIKITAEDRITFYQRGRDYSIDTFPDRVEIRRNPTGEIADGETVLIDYVFTVGGSFDLDTLNHQFSFQQEFDFGLTPYYRLRFQDQTITPADATGAVAEDITAHTVGAEYRRKPFRLSAEYEDYNSTINPFRAIRLTAGYRNTFSFGATVDLRARWTKVAHRAPQRLVRFLTLESLYRHPITRSLTVEGAVIYRDERDSIGRDNKGMDIDLSLEWIIRQTEIRVTYELNQFDDDFTDNNSSILFVQVRRNF